MAISKSWFAATVLCLLVLATAASEEEEKHSFVLTLDAANFSETVSKHPFIVVEFYAPWCGHCKSLAPEYEKAAEVLSTNDPPVVLAKIDASDATNKEVASKYEIQGFPTLKILRNGGESIQNYNGPRDADGIVEYLKEQLGPASKEIKSSEEALSVIDDKKISIVGIFTEFSGKEFETYSKVAEKLRSDYDFRHTLDAKLLPRGDTTIKQPVIRLFKPFDELFVDFKEFNVDAIENFIESASTPLVVTFDNDPSNHPYLSKFFESPNIKAMLFVDFGSEHFNAFKSKLNQLAKDYKVKNINFLIGDLDASERAFEYFGVKKDQAPVIILQEERQKYFQPNVSPEQIETWLKDYTDGSLKPYIKSEPIPEVNDEPVKVVVANNLPDVVFNSGKNVLLEFYAPWCGHCKKLAPILDEVAVSFADDADVVIAKMDATANDVPAQFEVHGFPTLYFSSASGKISQYDGNRTAEDIIDFVKRNRGAIDSPKSDDNLKDEL